MPRRPLTPGVISTVFGRRKHKARDLTCAEKPANCLNFHSNRKRTQSIRLSGASFQLIWPAPVSRHYKVSENQKRKDLKVCCFQILPLRFYFFWRTFLMSPSLDIFLTSSIFPFSPVITLMPGPASNTFLPLIKPSAPFPF